MAGILMAGARAVPVTAEVCVASSDSKTLFTHW